jgi:hypothetical protein
MRKEGVFCINQTILQIRTNSSKTDTCSKQEFFHFLYEVAPGGLGGQEDENKRKHKDPFRLEVGPDFFGLGLCSGFIHTLGSIFGRLKNSLNKLGLGFTK